MNFGGIGGWPSSLVMNVRSVDMIRVRESVRWKFVTVNFCLYGKRKHKSFPPAGGQFNCWAGVVARLGSPTKGVRLVAALPVVFAGAMANQVFASSAVTNSR